MADNVQAEAVVSAGTRFVTVETTFGGDAAHAPGCFVGIVTGSEGSRTFTELVGNSGNLAAGVQRVCVATDDVNLSAIKTALEIIDDWDSSDACKVVGPAAHDAAVSGNPILLGAVLDDLSPDTIDDGDIGRLRCDARRNLYVTVRDANNERGLRVDAAGAISVTNGGTFVVQSQQSGTWNIGTITSAIVPGTSATQLGKAEDNPHTSGDTGVFMLAVRSDTAAATGTTDGDYTALVTDSSGRLHVNVGNTITVASHAVTNAGTFAVQVDGSALTALQLADDVVYVDDADWTATTSKHTLVGGVYQSSPGTITDGDTGPLRVNENGALHVAIVSGAGSGGTAAADDADFVDGTTSGTPAMGVYESTPTTVTDGDLGVVGITEERALKVHLVNGGAGGTSASDDDDFTDGSTAGNPVMGVYESSPSSVTDGDLGMVGITQTRALRVSVENTVTVASHAVTNAGTFAVQAAQSGTWNITNVSGTVSLPTGAATAAKQPALGTAGSASADVITVQGVASMTPVQVSQATASNLNATVVGTGTFSVQVSSLPASTNTIEVVGDAAHDAAIAGNPVRIAGRAATSNYTAVAAGDTADLLATILGKLVNQPYALPGTTWSYASANGGVTDTADDEAKAAGGSGVRQYVTRVQAINGHATTSTEVVIKTGSTVLWRGWAQAAGGGAAATFDPPLRGGDNEAINVANVTNSSQTYFNLQGYTAAE